MWGSPSQHLKVEFATRLKRCCQAEVSVEGRVLAPVQPACHSAWSRRWAQLVLGRKQACCYRIKREGIYQRKRRSAGTQRKAVSCYDFVRGPLLRFLIHRYADTMLPPKETPISTMIPIFTALECTILNSSLPK